MTIFAYFTEVGQLYLAEYVCFPTDWKVQNMLNMPEGSVIQVTVVPVDES